MKPTQEQVLAWARETGMIGTGAAGNELERRYREAILDALPRFAVRVYAAGAAAMKERCAKVCESEEQRILSKQSGRDFDQVDTNLRMIACFLPDIAAAIRALGDDDE